MKYTIEISYRTGDSYSSQDMLSDVDHEWNDLEVVQDNLNSIKEHYEMYEEFGNSYQGRFKEIRKKYGKKKWFVVKTTAKDPEYYCLNSIILVTDDRKEFQYNCFWTGFFEALYSAEIK